MVLTMDPMTLDGVLANLTQLGAAGLIGLLWVFERRAAQQRDRQLNEAHQKLMSRQHELEAMLKVVKENTAAIKSLEHTHRRLIELLKTRRSADQAHLFSSVCRLRLRMEGERG